MKSLLILMLFSGAVTPAVASTTTVAPVVAQAPAAAKAPSDLVNINTATVAQLEALPGIGAATAKRILEHREKNGEFKKAEEILESCSSCPYSLRIL